MSDQIVITGMGVVSPVGNDEHTFWQALQQGQSGAAPITGLDTSELTRTVACEVKGELHDPYFEQCRETSRHVGRASRLAVVAARQAVNDAGLSSSSLAGARTQVFAGTTMGETQFIEDGLTADESAWLSTSQLQQIGHGMPGAIADSITTALGGDDWPTPTRRHDIYGACAAGNLALHAARRSLLSNQCDIAIAGGADGFSRLAFIGFMRLRVMAESTCRPFDRDRDGLFVGEGAAFFVLERESQARARSARARAQLLGAALTCEDYHPTRPQPEGDGLTRATKRSLQQASLQPRDVDYVCAHGTGTPQNDAIEAKVLESCFPDGIAFSSVKALTGHTMGAAAAVEAACCILSLEHQSLIPTWTLENPLDHEGLDPIMKQPRSASVQVVVNNSAGFGGYNSSVVLGAA
ncbi:MAG: beta-ketoacyl-[acyl-carrier-protein] synthase family protein [Phycisphaerae bacterium]